MAREKLDVYIIWYHTTVDRSLLLVIVIVGKRFPHSHLIAAGSVRHFNGTKYGQTEENRDRFHAMKLTTGLNLLRCTQEHEPRAKL